MSVDRFVTILLVISYGLALVILVPFLLALAAEPAALVLFLAIVAMIVHGALAWAFQRPDWWRAL